MIARLIAVAVAAAALSGCVSMPSDRSSVPVLQPKSLDRVDLIAALDPDGRGCLPVEKATTPPKPTEDRAAIAADYCAKLPTNEERVHAISDFWITLGLDSSDTRQANDAALAHVRARLEAAFSGFYLYQSDSTLRRNRLQHRLLDASDTNCVAFTSNLYSTQAWYNFTTGLAALGVTTAGAIVTGAGTARLLSGIGAAFAGARAEGNDDFFRKMYVEAIAKAIENKRTQMRLDMEKRAQDDIKSYTVEAAVGDALRYNNACSLVEGLGEVQHAVAISDDPSGLKTFRAAMARAGYDTNIVFHRDGTLPGAGQSAAQQAQAAVGLVSIKSWLADLAARKAIVLAPLKDSDATDKAKKDNINKITAPFTPDTTHAFGAGLDEYTTRLSELSAIYDKLLASMQKADSNADRERLSTLMGANDRDAAVVVNEVREMIDDVQRQIDN